MSATEVIVSGKTLPLAPKNEAAATGLAQYLAPLPADSGLTEGQYVNVQVLVYQGENSLLPLDALLSTGNQTFVFHHEDGSVQSSLDGGKAVKTAVDIVARGSEGVVVAQALAGKQVLLAKPDLLLRVAAGVPVKLIGAAAPAAKKVEGGKDNG